MTYKNIASQTYVNHKSLACVCTDPIWSLTPKGRIDVQIAATTQMENCKCDQYNCITYGHYIYPCCSV